MIAAWTGSILSPVAVRVNSEADTMNRNLMAARRWRHYLLTQRVTGIERHQRRASATGGC